MKKQTALEKEIARWERDGYSGNTLIAIVDSVEYLTATEWCNSWDVDAGNVRRFKLSTTASRLRCARIAGWQEDLARPIREQAELRASHMTIEKHLLELQRKGMVACDHCNAPVKRRAAWRLDTGVYGDRYFCRHACAEAASAQMHNIYPVLPPPALRS